MGGERRARGWGGGEGLGGGRSWGGGVRGIGTTKPQRSVSGRHAMLMEYNVTSIYRARKKQSKSNNNNHHIKSIKNNN